MAAPGRTPPSAASSLGLKGIAAPSLRLRHRLFCFNAMTTPDDASSTPRSACGLPAGDYRPEIDGLRAVAVVPVILFHLDFPWCAGGYVGVDVFFVISGFLITRLILAAIQQDRFSLLTFWGRRIRRVMPAMLAVCAATVVATFAMAFPLDWPDVGKQTLAALGALSNIYSWTTFVDYWGPAAEHAPLLHTWSLSVEEQFYLLYPLFVMVMCRWRPKLLPLALSTLLAGSLALYVYGRVAHPRAAFYLLPTRAWELLAGGLLAAADARERRSCHGTPWGKLLELLAIPGILAAFLVPHTETVRELLAVAGTATIIRHPGGALNRWVLRNTVAIQTGRLSYSLYLWHWPVIVLAGEFGRRPPWIVQILVTCGLAVVSYLLIERPARSSKGSFPWIAAAYVGTVCLAATLLLLQRTYDTSTYAVPEFLGVRYSVNPDEPIRPSRRDACIGVRLPPQIASPDAYRTGGLVLPGRQPFPAIVVLGDSHGLMWSDVIHAIATESDTTLSLWSMSGESPALRFPLADNSRFGRRLTPEQKLDYDTARVRLIEQWKPKIAIVARRWTMEHPGGLDELVAFLCQHAERVFLVEQPPEIARLKERNLLPYLAYRHIVPSEGVRHYLPVNDPIEEATARAMVRDLEARYPRCTVIPVRDIYARGDEVLVLDGREAIYTDDDHLTTYGARLAISRFREAIEAVLRETPTP